MLSFMIVCFIWLIHSDVIYSIENTTVSGQRRFGYVNSSVTQLSVPEDHHVCLPCQGPDVIWTHQNTKVLVTRRGSYQTYQDRRRYILLMDGSLCLLKLDDSDGGEYQCNQQLVAELQVLTGNDFQVSAGWTLLLPCRGSFKTKQRWFRQREREKKEVIFTRFRNGTEKPERDGDRLSYTNNALQIRDLQPEDAGEYQCNGVLQARVSVLEDAVEIKNKTKKKHENVLMLVAVSGFVLMTISLVTVCALLISTKCRRRNRKYKYAEKGHVDTELSG
uniref:Ig-like domain-containing protein n=1 Tax=Nothobranchius pienaari TaxID=704102 RepID=A0A1A8P4P5_9TELE